MKKRILLLCLFCMTLGFAYSQKPDPEITNMNKTVISTSGKKSLIKAENLKKAWTPSYIHVISISPKANLEAFIRLGKLLKEAPMQYSPENTLIVCVDKYIDFIKETATGYKIVQLSGLGSSDSMIIEGTITPLTKEDNEPGYDFKFVEEKAL